MIVANVGLESMTRAGIGCRLNKIGMKATANLGVGIGTLLLGMFV